MNDRNALAQLRSGDMRALQWIYEKYRAIFIGTLVKHCRCDPEEALEHYQEAVLTLHRIVGAEKEISNLRAYLVGIGINLWRADERKKKRDAAAPPLPEHTDDTAEEVEGQLTRLERALQALGESCRTLLHLLYFQNKPYREIILTTGHTNEQKARAQAYRCLRSLREEFTKTRNA